MSDCGSLENVDPNESISGNNSSNEKKLELPSEFFELLGDAEGKKARLYRCLFEGCKMKVKKDGTQKPLIVFNDTRFNAKRHYLSHDPNNSLGHKDKWRKAVDKLKESSDTHHITTRPSVQRLSSQTDLDNWVMNFLIVDVLPMHVVEKAGFKTLVSSLAPHLQLRGRTFFTNMLETKYEERKLQLKAALSRCTDAATTVDAWTCRRRSYLGETIHWYSSDSLKRKSACLATRRIVGRHTFDVLCKIIESVHEEFQVKDKLRGATTDNGCNFIKCFREKGATSSLPDYDSMMQEEEDAYLGIESDVEEMLYFEIGEILDDPVVNTSALLPETVTLPVHRRCACHLLSLVSKVDVQKIQDFTFQQLRMSSMEKLQKIWNKQNSSSLNSDTIFHHLGRLLVLKNDTRWNSEYSAICSFVRLLRKKNRGMKKLFEEFGINTITPNEEQYLKEFVTVMKSVAEALDILQAEKNVGMGFLLPTISVLKNNLKLLKDDSSIIYCQPLITSLLDAIHFRFEKMFSDNELRLATISNPMFKLSWLESEDDIRRAKSLLKCEYQRLQGVMEMSDSSEESSDGTSSSRSDPSPPKRAKKDFFSSITKKLNKQQTEDEVEKYLKFCNNLEQLEDYPTMSVIYKRYNVTLPSSAAVERLFSQGGLIYSPKRLKLTDRHFEILLFLKVNSSVFNEW